MHEASRPVRFMKSPIGHRLDYQIAVKPLPIVPADACRAINQAPDLIAHALVTKLL